MEKGVHDVAYPCFITEQLQKFYRIEIDRGGGSGTFFHGLHRLTAGGMVMFHLVRLCERPILGPRSEHPWEAAAVFNPGVAQQGDRTVLLYRAADLPFTEYGHPTAYHSCIGYASSTDGIHFTRNDAPVFVGSLPQEARGVEDPRVTFLDGRFYMVYTAFGGRGPGDWRLAMADSDDLLHWEHRRILLDETNKDGALLPARMGGRYYLFHRREPSIWICDSSDGLHWEHHRIVMTPRGEGWESVRIGIAGPPLLLPEGWLLLYHAVDRQRVYRLGAALLDKNDPGRVLVRLDQPVFFPRLSWECQGLVPNVVFSCGAAALPDRLLVYYGAADTWIGVAGLPWHAIDWSQNYPVTVNERSGNKR